MENVSNSVLLDTLMKALYAVASRRTSKKFADETIGSTIKTLEKKYDFLKFVDINLRSVADGDIAVSISPEIDSIKKNIILDITQRA